MTSHWVRACCALFLGAWCSCTGGETGNPPNALDSFDTPGCKSELNGKSAAGPAGLSSVQDDPRYDGLSCFVWQRLDEQSMRIELTNHEDGCGLDGSWVPRATLQEGKLGLHLDVPDCIFAGCFSCVYDLSFVVKVPASIADLDVQLLSDTCSGPARVEREAQLALGSATRGEVCRYAASTQLGDCNEGESAGSLFAECSKLGAECYASGDTCQPGLTCVTLGAEQKRCLPACESDADCAGHATTRCVEGTCRL